MLLELAQSDKKCRYFITHFLYILCVCVCHVRRKTLYSDNDSKPDIILKPNSI